MINKQITNSKSQTNPNNQYVILSEAKNLKRSFAPPGLRMTCHLVIGISVLFVICVLEFGIFSYAQDFTYNSKGKRDPFMPLVGAGAVYETKEAVEINSLQDVVLEGIVYDEKGGSRAIINSMILKEGDKAGAMTIEKIEPKKVTLQIGDETHEVILSEDKGGEGK